MDVVDAAGTFHARVAAADVAQLFDAATHALVLARAESGVGVGDGGALTAAVPMLCKAVSLADLAERSRLKVHTRDQKAAAAAAKAARKPKNEAKEFAFGWAIDERDLLTHRRKAIEAALDKGVRVVVVFGAKRSKTSRRVPPEDKRRLVALVESVCTDAGARRAAPDAGSIDGQLTLTFGR
ncbi:uncharacterized protein V1510DRAFT_422336 [Dipodascopsis tothii]|uniref:uncharacterized protein n=1 Tax=Dipodascopsis tothii TaxID=44089 RepID=UPI0034CE1525